MVVKLRARLVGLLPVACFPLAMGDVRLIGDACPLSIEIPASVVDSARAAPSLVDREGIQAVVVPVPRNRLAGFVAETVKDDEELLPTCEVVLVDVESIEYVYRQGLSDSSDLAIIWKEVGEVKPGGRGYVVAAGKYRFRFSFLLAHPSKKGKVGLWTVRSPVFSLTKSRAWTTFN